MKARSFIIGSQYLLSFCNSLVIKVRENLATLGCFYDLMKEFFFF